MINLKINPLWSKTVLFITFSFLLILSSYVIFDPKGSASVLSTVYSFFAVNFESAFLIFGILTFVTLVIIGVSSIGSNKIIIPGRSTYSYFSWGSMLFATGMGAALLYWSTYEWLVYYTNPISEDTKLLNSRSYPLFHWMFTGWALYILPTVAFSMCLSRKKKSPLTF